MYHSFTGNSGCTLHKDEREFEIGHSRHGYYFVRVENIKRNLATSATHTLFDGKVGHIVANLFDYGTRSVSFAGTHRCFSDDFSTCSGTTSVCGNGSEKFRVTDIAHGESLYKEYKIIVITN